MLDGSDRARVEKRCPAVAWEGRLYSRGDARYRVVVTHHDCYTVEIETVDDMLHPKWERVDDDSSSHQVAVAAMAHALLDMKAKQ